VKTPTLADYTVVIRPEDGMFVAYVPAIEGCHAQGDTAEEARAELDSVFDMVVEHYLEKQWPFPPDVRELVPVAS
jgi:predicted RNase H-like HicB family nuclease